MCVCIYVFGCLCVFIILFSVNSLFIFILLLFVYFLFLVFFFSFLAGVPELSFWLWLKCYMAQISQRTLNHWNNWILKPLKIVFSVFVCLLLFFCFCFCFLFVFPFFFFFFTKFFFWMFSSIQRVVLKKYYSCVVFSFWSQYSSRIFPALTCGLFGIAAFVDIVGPSLGIPVPWIYLQC